MPRQGRINAFLIVLGIVVVAMNLTIHEGFLNQKSYLQLNLDYMKMFSSASEAITNPNTGYAAVFANAKAPPH
jgi:hypothetical protein